MKWVLIVAAALVVLVALVALVGSLLPRGHVASRAARLRQPPEAVWAAITDHQTFPSWRSGVRRTEPLGDGRSGWREVRKDGWNMALEVVESSPPRRLVLRIAEPKLPFGGTWTYDLAPADGGTELRITENGEVYNPLFRALSHLFGLTATIRQYLGDLGRRFGEAVTVVE